MRLVLAVLAVLAVQAAIAGPAHAQSAPPDVPAAGDDRPWAASVSSEEQAVALGFFDQGNNEFLYSRFAQAMTFYHQAIAHWDHPAIRFNMAVSLINLGQIVEARDNLERAMAYGAAPLGDDVMLQAETYRKLLDGQLVRLTVRCDDPGADVSLDGKHLFDGPGAASSYVLPGEHQVVATRAGYLTATHPLDLVAGKPFTLAVKLVVLAEVTTTRRWARWKPYAVATGGAALLATGGVVLAAAASDYHAFDDAARGACPRGCSAAQVAAHPELATLDARADREQLIARSLLVTGGVVAVAGALGLYLNQPRPRGWRPAAVVAPGPGRGALSLRWAF